MQRKIDKIPTWAAPRERCSRAPVKHVLNKSILDYSAPAIRKAAFNNISQNQWDKDIYCESASLHRGNRRLNQRFLGAFHPHAARRPAQE